MLVPDRDERHEDVKVVDGDMDAVMLRYSEVTAFAFVVCLVPSPLSFFYN